MPITDNGLTHPVSREDIDKSADKLLPDNPEGDQRERALADIHASASRHRAWIDSRNVEERAELLSQPAITFPVQDDSDSGSKSSSKSRSRKKGG